MNEKESICYLVADQVVREARENADYRSRLGKYLGRELRQADVKTQALKESLRKDIINNLDKLSLEDLKSITGPEEALGNYKATRR